MALERGGHNYKKSLIHVIAAALLTKNTTVFSLWISTSGKIPPCWPHLWVHPDGYSEIIFDKGSLVKHLVRIWQKFSHIKQELVNCIHVIHCAPGSWRFVKRKHITLFKTIFFYHLINCLINYIGNATFTKIHFDKMVSL